MSEALRVKNLVEAAWRRKWWIIVPPVVGLLVSVVLIYKLPKLYRATTTVLVVSQRLPETYVKTTVTSGLKERLASLRVQILGPSYLDRVIAELGLASPEASQQHMERLRGRLLRRIDVPDMPRNASFFEISVNDEKADRAAKIANLLADLFIEQNGRQRTEQAASTSAQMKVWVDEKKQLLESLEERVAAYRRAYFGELPDQQGTNLQLINVAQGRLGQVSDGLAQRRSRIEALRSQLQTMGSINSAAGLPTDMDPRLGRLRQLESELSNLRLSYTDQNPDVRKKLAEIEEFRRLNPDLVAAVPGGDADPSALGGPTAEIARLQGEIARLETERAALNNQIDQLTARVRNTPLREQELAQITRDRDTLRADYQDLQRKYDEAKRAEDLETGRQAEHFRVQDRAAVPSVPYSPKPPQLIGLGLLVGLALGVGLAFLIEMLDQTVRTEEAFRAAFPDLPLLVSIPNLQAAAVSATQGPGKGKGRKSAAALLLAMGPLVSAFARFV